MINQLATPSVSSSLFDHSCVLGGDCVAIIPYLLLINFYVAHHIGTINKKQEVLSFTLAYEVPYVRRMCCTLFCLVLSAFPYTFMLPIVERSSVIHVC